MLLRARNDGHWYPVEVTGRFTIEAECAASPAHRTKAIESATMAFFENQKRSHNSHWNPGFPVRVQGPLPHLEFSENASPDLGPGERPDPRDRDRWEAYERAEKARSARKAGLSVGLVDFTITARFNRKMRQELLTIAPAAAAHNPQLVLAK